MTTPPNHRPIPSHGPAPTNPSSHSSRPSHIPNPTTPASHSSLPSHTEVFEYALIRVVPRVERGEAINAGVLVYSKSFGYLGCETELNEARLLALDPNTDVTAVRAALGAFERACTEGPLADRPLGERFRWLTAPRSAIVQPGPVHSGITTDPAAELDRLFTTLVST
jgi:Protein of unknown function (DUF3037)